ncbi:MAG: cysteine desulfurase/selenocysteine lyase [Verrucomicrobiales bacterium]|jgi:cysteine desulfurase/selenocysteine lyase
MPTAEESELRSHFPILSQEVNGKPLVYLDNGATTQKPKAVIERLSQFFSHENANIHRGVHYLSMQASDAYDQARSSVANFINAQHDDEIVFVRGTTEAINLVARSFGVPALGEGDEILVTVMEHHANIVPWQLVAEECGAKVVVAPIDDRGELIVEAFEKLLSERTKIVAVMHASNVLGTINPVRQLVDQAHARGVPVLVDGAQAVAHFPVDVQELGCDFYVFSGHKMFAPDGIGVLYGRREHLRDMRPYHGGGDMIEQVSFGGTTFRQPPERFEAGTPNISGAIGLAAAIDFLNAIGWERLHAQETKLLKYATEVLGKLPGLSITGTSDDKVGVISFLLGDIHPHDIGTILDTRGIAVRAGHHCAQPLMERLGVNGTTRASFAFYNTLEEVDQLAEALDHVNRLFKA